MLVVSQLLPQAGGLAPVLLKRASTLTQDWDTRQKGRFDAEDSLGRRLAVVLPRGTALRGGAVLVAEGGSLIRVVAQPQPVTVVRTAADGSAFDLLRAAYHRGNRHVALELQPDRLQLEPDHVLAEMLRMMGLLVSDELAAFEPEGGAYAAHGSPRAGRAHSHGDGVMHVHA